MMGGIVTDLDARSTLPGLYAVGEASCTGLHGANRLASNSLSECFVFARRAVARRARRRRAPRAAPPSAAELAGAAPRCRRRRAPTRETRAALWRDAGIVRTRGGPERPARATRTRSRG